MPLTLEGKPSIRPNSLGNNNARKHGGYSKRLSFEDSVKFQALLNIKERSRRRGYESDLEVSDLPSVPLFCPVLGFAFRHGSLANKDSSPSIDRINPNLPYLKKYRDNLRFISHRANRIKSNATVEELLQIVAYMKRLGDVKLSLMDSKPFQILGNEAEVEEHRERLSERAPEMAMQ